MSVAQDIPLAQFKLENTCLLCAAVDLTQASSWFIKILMLDNRLGLYLAARFSFVS